MSAPGTDFRRGYASAFAEHLASPAEATLRAAYELGREAVARELGVLELAMVHHDLLVAALRGVSGPEAERIAAAAGTFFMESLSAYEMVRRGFREARDAAALERRHARSIRRLSSFLGDASLAHDGPGTTAEMLQLVAEQARELVGASGCIVAAFARTRDASWTVASSPAGLAEAPPGSLEAQLLAVDELLWTRGATRMGAEELERHPAIRALPGTDVGAPRRGWLGVPLVALDSRPLGSIQVFDWETGGPTEVEEALVMHLAQMVAAAVERTRLYHE